MDQQMYDVCNDYTLDPTDEQPDMNLYRTFEGFGGTVYVHKKHEEIHFFKGKKGLQGVVLPYID